MIRELSGREIADFVQERQARQVRNLKQEHGIEPRLTILMSDQATAASDVYVHMKSRYADDIGIVCDIIKLSEDELIPHIKAFNSDSKVHGIIVQLPLSNASQTQNVCDEIDPAKDVDGLGSSARYTSATAEAIDWLLAGYNIDLDDKHIAIVGNGKLVGRPLNELWLKQGYDVSVVDVDTPNARDILRSSDVIVSASGVPRRLTSEDVSLGAVVVDAGTASENGVLVGDADDSLRERSDIKITPLKGGVGPLTVAVLFDHVIQAGLRLAGKL